MKELVVEEEEEKAVVDEHGNSAIYRAAQYLVLCGKLKWGSCGADVHLDRANDVTHTTLCVVLLESTELWKEVFSLNFRH